MRKICIYILVLIINFNTCLFEQLFKVPVLVEHYMEHQDRNAGISFTDFLAMHYWGNDMNDNDEERDKQLPFKNVDHHVSHFVFIPNRIYTSNVRVVHTNSDIVINYTDTLRHNPHLGALFRPPIA